MENLVVWITIGVYAVVLIVVAAVTGRKAKRVADLTVGGRNSGAWTTALSYSTAYFSAVMFVGYAGTAGLNYGLWSVLVGIGNAVFGSWLAWRVLAKRTRDVTKRLKIKTMPQLLEKRFESKAMKTFAAIVIFIFMIPYSASVYQGLKSICSVLLGVDETICLVVIAVLSLLILVFGGFAAQAKTDLIQGIIMMFGVAFLIFFVIRSEAVGGVQGLLEYAKTDVGLPKLGTASIIALISMILMTSFGTWGLPQMVTKYFSLRDDKQAKKGILISTFFGILVAGGGYFIGSLCHKFFTLDSETLAAMGGKDYVVSNMLKDTHMPSVLLGIVITLLLAASISTLCSISITSSSTLIIDLFKPKFKKEINDKNTGILIKVLCALFVVLSFALAMANFESITVMMGYSWGIISGSFMAPYVISLYWKKLNKFGGWFGMLGGFFTASIPFVCKILTYVVKSESLTKIAGYSMQFAVLAMAVSFALCFIGSLVYNALRKPEENTYFYTGDVWKEAENTVAK